MNYQSITFEKRGNIALITLNRPEALNTFTGDMGEEWSHAYKLCDNDDEIRVIVVTGAGKAFCAGADMSQGGDTFDSKDDMSFSSCPIYPAWKLRKPVIAAMNGHAVGVGFSLALQCDFRIVAAEGKYGLLQVRRGVLADGCAHWLLPRLVGMERALEVMLLGRKMSGDEVVSKGLAMQSVPADQVLDVALAMAEDLAINCAPLVTGLAKQLMWSSNTMSLDEMEKKETELLHYTMGKPDAIEGGVAYFEKRAPKWQSVISKDWPNEK